MRSLLLDTVTLIRWTLGRVPNRVRRLMNQPGTSLYVSTISPWEITLKPQLRRYGLTQKDLLTVMSDALAVELLPVTLPHAVEFNQLPQFTEHTDPFDRMLIAQALAERYTLVSPDTRFPLYEPHGLQLLWE